MQKSKESKLRGSRRHTSNFLLYVSNRYSGEHTLYTTVYIQTEVKKLQVLCSTLSVRRFMLKSWNYSKSHCSGKSVRRRLWSKKKCLPIFYEARKSVRRHLWSKKKRLSIFYEARKSVRRHLWSKKKRLSILYEARKSVRRRLWSNFTKSVLRWPKKRLSTFEKKKCSSTVYYITLRKISANGSEARQISHNKVQTFFCLTT